MAAESITQNMKHDADDIESWARRIADRANDREIKQLADRIRRTARDIFD